MNMLIKALTVVALTVMTASSVLAQSRMAPQTAYFGGTYFGQDPDINVVGSLEREASSAVGN